MESANDRTKDVKGSLKKKKRNRNNQYLIQAGGRHHEGAGNCQTAGRIAFAKGKAYSLVLLPKIRFKLYISNVPLLGNAYRPSEDGPQHATSEKVLKPGVGW